MKTKSLLNRRVQLAFGVAILTLLAAGTISYRGLVVSAESDKWVRHTHEVLENLQDLLAAMQSVESGFREMVVTGNESYLKAYRSNMASAEQYELAIGNSTVDNPVQLRQLPTIKKLMPQKIQFTDSVITLRQAKGLQAAAEVIGEGTGQWIMDEFQALIREMQVEEPRLLALREVEAKRRLDQTKAALVLGTLMGLFTAAFAAWSAQRDSSGRALAEAELHDSEVKFRGILESAPDAMVIADGQGRIVLVNEETERLFGYSRDELVGQLVDILVPERFRGKHPQHRDGYTEHPRRRSMGEGRSLWDLRKDNTEFPVEISLSPLESAEGVLVTTAIRDISVRKAAENNMAETAGQLGVKHRLLDAVVEGTTDPIYIRDLENRFTMANAACAKILRQSVNELVGSSLRDLLPNDSSDAVVKSDRETVCAGVPCTIEETVEIEGVTRHFLTTKGPYYVGTKGNALREISSDKALNEALAYLRAAMEESGAVVTHDALPIITTDDAQLALVFQNLVGNAIKYHGPEVPHVHVSAKKNGGKDWIFSVRDNGLSIDPQYVERIFLLFQRLHGRKEFKGTGIELAIARRLLSGWAGGSGWSRNPKRAQPSTLHCRKGTGNDGIN